MLTRDSIWVHSIFNPPIFLRSFAFLSTWILLQFNYRIDKWSLHAQKHSKSQKNIQFKRMTEVCKIFICLRNIFAFMAYFQKNVSIDNFLFTAIRLSQKIGNFSLSDVKFLHFMAKNGKISSKFPLHKIKSQNSL